MSNSGFSNVEHKETLKVPSDTIDKNNFTNMKLLKSIYDESFDIANEFFSNKKEGFEDDDDDIFCFFLSLSPRTETTFDCLLATLFSAALTRSYVFLLNSVLEKEPGINIPRTLFL